MLTAPLFDIIETYNLIERYPLEIREHTERVAEYVEIYGGTCKYVALLHDIIEDTETTLNEIPKDMRNDVDILTRKENETYFDYIHRIKNSGSRIAIIVKLADIYDHLTQIETLKPSLKKRYEKAIKILKGLDI